MNFNANTPKSQRPPLRGDLQTAYDRSRANLLLVLIFTVINLFFVTFANRYFLFSATIPMLFPLSAAEIVAELSAQGAPADEKTITIIVGLVLGLILTVPYLLCWIFSKKRVGWMVGALAFFSIDCLFLLISFDVSMLMDILIHAWVMFYLITGVINGFKLKNMPEEQPLPEFDAETPAEAPAAESELPAFDESLFDLPVENTSAEEQEPVVARSFDEIMAENQKDGQ